MILFNIEVIGVTPVQSMLQQLAQRHGRGHPVAARGMRTARASLRRRDTRPAGIAAHAREHMFCSAVTPAERDRGHAGRRHLTKETLAIPASASAYAQPPLVEKGNGLPVAAAMPRPERDPQRFLMILLR
jgi:ferredoxin-NADP reductase